MRGVFWLLGLAAAAVALALLVGGNAANVTLYWHPWRIDVSFNFLLLILLLVFGLFYGALRALALLRSLPQQAQRWRTHHMERAALMAVVDAMVHQLSGRLVRSKASAQRALRQLELLEGQPFAGSDQVRVLAYLMAAESAQALGNAEERDIWLQFALEGESARHAPEARHGVLMRAASWALDQRDASAAGDWLAELPQGVSRRVQSLRLKLRLARLRQDHAGAMDIVRLLTKHRGYSPDASRSLLRGLALDAMRACRDRTHLHRVWHGLGASERAMPELAIAALEFWGRLGDPGSDEAAAVSERLWVADCLQAAWSGYSELGSDMRRRFLLRAEAVLPQLDADWLARIEQAQLAQPQDAGLAYLAGQAYMQRQLWGKASALLGQASARLTDPELSRRAWRSLARLADQRGEPQAALVAWKRAAES
jgi:HemY protein